MSAAASTNGNPPGEAAGSGRSIDADLVDLLYAQSAINRYHPLLVFAAVAPFFLPHVPWWTLAVIVALQLSGTLFANRLRARHAKLRPDADREPWARAYMRVTGLCAASWGAAGILWFVPDSLPHQALLAVVLSGGVTGSMVSRAPYMPTLWLFILLSGAPLIAMLLLTGNPISQIIAVLGLIYAAGVLGWARAIHAMHRREIGARREKTRLMSELAAARDEAEARAAEAVKARKAAEAGERAKAEFLAMMSHEVRTPLNGIQGMAEVLQGTPMDDRQREFLSVIRASSESLRVLLDDILELSRLEQGETELEDTTFDPAAVAAEVIHIAGPEASRKGLELTLDSALEVPKSARGDNRRIRQVLVNLTGNAIKFTDAGRVRLAVSVEPGESGEVLRYAVRDTGIGIEPAMLDRLFDNFTQADQSITRRHGGGGLGLALARRLVSQMGGTICVRSTPGEGSEFWFDLPLRPAAGTVAARDATARDATAPAGSPAAAAGSGDETDPSRLRELEEKLGREKTVEIVEAYLETAWKLADTIRAAGESRDVEALVRAAHDLKSAAGTIGLTGLAARAAAMEADLRTGRDEPAIDAARTVPDAMANAHEALLLVYPDAMR